MERMRDVWFAVMGIKEEVEVAIKKNALGKALETSIPESIYDELKKIIDGK